MNITYHEYIENPMQNRVMSNRNIYRKMYSDKLDALIVRENGKIPYYLFKDSDKRYLALIKVPSETVKGFFYDVVIEFRTDDTNSINSRSIKDYYVRFYSNDPAFMYNFCYSFIQNDLFVKDMQSKMSKVARTTNASVTNSKNEVGYCKSLYFAYLIMEYRGLFDKSKWSEQGRKYDKNILLSMVEHTTTKHINRQQMEADAKKAKKKFEAAKKVDDKSAKSASTSSNVKLISKTTTTSKAKHVKRI